MKNIRAVLFDLDHTLWDFRANSRETIADLYHRHQLQALGVLSLDEFISVYERINHDMWNAYSTGQIGKEFLRKGRFANTLERFSIHDDALAESLATDYVKESPLKKNLFPFVHETLSHLQGRYSLLMITNGFTEVQHVKVANSGLKPYFDHVIVSEQTGFKKPHKAIFDYAASLASTTSDKCLMVGDNLEADIDGALAAGMQACLFDPYKEHHLKDTHSTINCLSELMERL
ncbi:MAG: YjjG family noncanonical pyrimidine nucleotidase [Bacteroidota bacterium]